MHKRMTAGYGTWKSPLTAARATAGALRFDHLVLAGYASEVTVDSTVRTLNDRGFECLVLSDGCAPLDADLGARALRSLTMSGGIFGAHGRTADSSRGRGAGG